MARRFHRNCIFTTPLSFSPIRPILRKFLQVCKTGWIATHASARDIEALRLLLLNDPAAGQTILWKLLHQSRLSLMHNSQFAELAAAWLNSRGQNDSVRSWLIRQYAHWLYTPLGRPSNIKQAGRWFDEYAQA
ncbi:MAG TPA: hypothetical protein VFN66_10810 [Burkholderiales bacterium]|nr:hypothetical protein [Burkholderiales bacterium]